MSIQVTIRYQGPIGFAPSKASIIAGARAVSRIMVVALMFLGTTIGGLGIGYGAWAYATVVRAAHLGARYAEIHGAEAVANPSDRTPLAREIEQIVRQNAGDLRAEALNVETMWPEKHAPDKTIRVRVAYSLPFLTGSLTFAGEGSGLIAPQYEMVVKN
jgi:hypothetical protein